MGISRALAGCRSGSLAGPPPRASGSRPHLGPRCPAAQQALAPRRARARARAVIPDRPRVQAEIRARRVTASSRHRIRRQAIQAHSPL